MRGFRDGIFVLQRIYVKFVTGFFILERDFQNVWIP
jgi:hypothetical protein